MPLTPAAVRRILLSIALGAALAAPGLVSAQTGTTSAAARDTTPIGFIGFRAGAPLSEVRERVRELDGRLRCDQAKADRRVTECRGTIVDPDLAGPVDIWLSAIDERSAVLTLSADVEPDQLDRWRTRLEEYGRVGAQVQGAQWMMQWVRQGRMARLTWRVQRKERVASVSLIDGGVLDGWGRERARAARGGTR